MNDNEKTKAQLIEELNELRAGVADHVLSSTGLGAKIMDCSGDAVYVIDPATGRILDVNSTACSNLGYSREELLAMGVTDIENTLPDDFSWKKHVDQLSPMTTHTSKMEKQPAGWRNGKTPESPTSICITTKITSSTTKRQIETKGPRYE